MKTLRYHTNNPIIKLMFIILFTTSCESFVEIAPPKTESVSGSVYSNDAAALSAIRGIYHEMERTGFASGTTSSLNFLAGLSSDELRSHFAALDDFYNNSLSPTNSIIYNDLWSAGYKYIYYSNSAIEGLSASTTLSNDLKSQLLGEAKFIRAFCHFYLVNLFGTAPLLLTTDYRKNAIEIRTGQDEIYNSIVKDLIECQALMAMDYQFTSGERVRPNAHAATALLARVYLYRGDWVNAEVQASKVISTTSLFSLISDLNNIFLKNSREAIWQLMPITPNANTNEAVYFVPASVTSVPAYVSLTDSFINSFEPNDNRKTSWISFSTVGVNKYNYPFKYKVNKTGQPLTEYSMVLRLAELYLIRAESRANQNNFTGALQDVDALRLRAGLPSKTLTIPVPTTQNVMQAVEQERRIELFSEWGHRWFDLKRWNKADQILQPIKAGWSSTDALYPVPLQELTANPNLNPQNSGY